MDDSGRMLDRGPALGDSVPLRAVCKADDVHGADDRDVPDRLACIARLAGPGIFRMGHACWSGDATVRI